MTPAERERIREAGRKLARESRKAQGLPPKLEDPETIRQIAILFRATREERRAS